ncbi:MAG: cysteine peptidase family C39 domain-containing protein [Planctomycetota bacterium]
MRAARSAGLAGAALSVLLGCTALPPVESPDAHGGLSERAVVLDVPLAYQRDRYDCGLGAVSMLFAYHATPAQPELARAFRAAAAAEGGLTGADLRSFVAAHGYEPFLFRGSNEGEGATTLRHHLDRGRPLIVALNAGGRANHFVLLTGYDPERELVLFHDPKRGGGAYPTWQFERLWKQGKHFTLLAVPPKR